MNSLYQRLKELSKDNFESLIDQLLQAKYPTAGITRVDGAGGDEGIDHFAGGLCDGPAVWQDKHFPNRIQQPQRKQILKSIKAAFKERTPRRWVLCVPIDLRTNEHNWFQDSVKAVYEREYPGRTTIELMQASHIVKDLLHFKTIREAFFPDAVSDVAKLKKLAMGSEELSTKQQVEITTEYAQQYLANMKDIDPRFTYSISIGNDRNLPMQIQTGQVLAIHDGDIVTHVFARDIEAIRLDPLKFQLHMLPAAAEKLRRAMDTGRPQSLLPGEVVSADSASRLFEFFKQDTCGLQVDIIPQVPDPERIIPLRFIFGKGQNAQKIRYLPFKYEYVGQREITLLSAGSLPIEVRLVLRPNVGATINITPVFTAANVRDLNHILQCMKALKTSPYLEVISIELDLPLLSGESPFSHEMDIEEGFIEMVADATSVASHFGVEIRLPENIQDDDLINLRTLKRIVTGETFSGVEVSADNLKDEAYQTNVLAALDRPSSYIRLEQHMSLYLFGTSIQTGPIVFECEEAAIVSVAETRRRYLDAAPGDPVTFVWDCRGNCRFKMDSTSAFLKNGGRAVDASIPASS